MKPEELYFSIQNGDNEYHEHPGMNIITFCPIQYWNENKCLPDYALDNDMEGIIIPEGWFYYVCIEETCWCSEKSQEEIRAELITMGFTESLEMTKFLDGLWLQ
jgi:hypothetical protein